MTFNPEECARLVAEVRAADAVVADAPWAATLHGSMSSNDYVLHGPRLMVDIVNEDDAKAIACFRNNAPLLADQLEAATREVVTLRSHSWLHIGPDNQWHPSDTRMLVDSNRDGVRLSGSTVDVLVAALNERDTLRAEVARLSLELIRVEIANSSLIPGAILTVTEIACLTVERDTLRAELVRLDIESDRETASLEYRESQIDKVADALGDDGEWSNCHDRGDAAIELARMVVADRDALRAELGRLQDVLGHLRGISDLDGRPCELCVSVNGSYARRCSMHATIDGLRARIAELEADFVAADERMAGVLDGTFSVGDGTAQVEIERLRTKIATLTEERDHALAHGVLSQRVCDLENENAHLRSAAGSPALAAVDAYRAAKK